MKALRGHRTVGILHSPATERALGKCTSCWTMVQPKIKLPLLAETNNQTGVQLLLLWSEHKGGVQIIPDISRVIGIFVDYLATDCASCAVTGQINANDSGIGVDRIAFYPILKTIMLCKRSEFYHA